MSFITVRHNIEVAHRLYELKGKCEQIHGHSMWIELKIHGHLDNHGVLEGLEFGKVKELFRDFLDKRYDHQLLLNKNDPWTQPLWTDKVDMPGKGAHGVQERLGPLPGLVVVPGDPTTENIARWIAEWASIEFRRNVDVKVQETHTNGAGYYAKYSGG